MRKHIRTGPRDRITVDVDSKHFRFERWDGEVNFEIETIGGERTNHYEIEPNEELPEGGYEFESILDEKPKKNVVEYKLNTKGVEFYYQPPLTQEEIDEGAHQPENVVGSYAVYASERKVNRVGGKLYRSGKVGHIYRPKIIDAEDNWVWGELEITGNRLKVTIPQGFLDSAVYPVIVDPTFGYDTVGSSSHNSFANEGMGVLETAPENGNINTITTYTGGNRTGVSYKGLVLNSSGEIQGVGDASSGSNEDWADLTGLNVDVIGSTDYGLAHVHNSGTTMRYDEVTDWISWFRDSNSFSTPQDFGSVTTNRRYSIYATYEASAAEPELPTVTTQAVTGIGETSATANGNITDDGNADITRRGFVYDTSTIGAPGNVDPDTLGVSVIDETGASLGEGAFDLSLTGLNDNTQYFVRAFAENSEGFAYGDEVDFTTLEASEPVEGWYNSNWTYRFSVTTNSGLVTNANGDLVFSTKVHGTVPSGFWTNVKSDGGDIRITQSDGETLVAREIVKIDTVGQELVIWLKADGLSTSANTEFYIYYGNESANEPSSNDTYGSENVWSEFDYVSHDGGATDSSGNGNNGTANGSITANGVDGQLGDATSFNGSSQFWNLGQPGVLNFTSSLTLFGLVYPTASGGHYPIFTKGDTQYAIKTNPNSRWEFFVHDGGWNAPQSDSTISTNQWTLFTGRYNTLNGAVEMFVNADKQNNSDTANNPTTNSFDIHIGHNSQATGRYWQGRMEHLRATGSVMSDAYVETLFNAIFQSNFWSVGAQEEFEDGAVDTVKVKVSGSFITAQKKVKISGTFQDVTTNVV